MRLEAPCGARLSTHPPSERSAEALSPDTDSLGCVRRAAAAHDVDLDQCQVGPITPFEDMIEEYALTSSMLRLALWVFAAMTTQRTQCRPTLSLDLVAQASPLRRQIERIGRLGRRSDATRINSGDASADSLELAQVSPPINRQTCRICLTWIARNAKRAGREPQRV